MNIYRKRRDEKNLVFGKPVHDWSSDFADAMRYLAVCYENIIRAEIIGKRVVSQKKVDFDPILTTLPRKRGASFRPNQRQYGQEDSRV